MADPKPLTFLKLPRVALDDLAGATVAVLGASEASPYKAGERSHSADAPTALREVSQEIARQLVQYDFDLDDSFFRDTDDTRGMVDCGDVATHAWASQANRDAIEAAVRKVLAAGAVPIVLGGDDSVPIPTIAAFADHGPLTILQIDAHVDWADVLQGNPYGYGSPMRRAAEFAHVTNMVQVGMRGLGSGEKWQHDDARAWGSHLVSSYMLHAEGLDAALKHVPAGARVFVSIDCDGIDPTVCPAVNMPTPGGLTYEDVIGLMRGIAAKAEIAGLALVEYCPQHDDRRKLSGQLAARIATVVMGLAAGLGPGGRTHGDIPAADPVPVDALAAVGA